MRIGVVADTHSRKLPKKMLDDFYHVDFIIHVGDFCEMDDLNVLKAIKEVKGVSGNMDDHKICSEFTRATIIPCGKLNIGLFHGEGSPRNILRSVVKEFESKKVDAVIFGHSHHPFNERIDGVLFFNPGSPTDKIFSPYRSYGILEISDEGIVGEIIKIEDNCHG